MNKPKRMFFVSYYECYPIYEPAEGGYYYEGIELIDSYVKGTLKGARRLLKKLSEEYALDTMLKDGAECSGKYIGDRRFLRIETVMGIKESGKVLYQ